MIAEWKNAYQERNMIMRLAKEDFRKRFVGSYFGVLWMFVQPIVTIVIYVFVFQLGFKAQPPSSIDAPYVLWLIPGIIPWFYFGEAVNMGTGVLSEYNYLVKKVVFHIDVLPLIKNIACFMVHMIFWLILVAAFLLYGYRPNLYWLQTLYYSFCAFVLILGVTKLTSAVNVFFKDMSQIVAIIIQFGMWVTPIMWSYDQFLGDKPWGKLLKLNPFYYISEGYRDSLLNHVGFWEHPELTLYFWGFTMGLLFLATKIFEKLRPHFADVL